MATLEKNLIPYGVHRNSDFSVFPDRSLDETRSAKLKAYAQAPALPSLAAGTPVHFLYLHYRNFTQIAAEEFAAEEL